jgi:hypothetical protein
VTGPVAEAFGVMSIDIYVIIAAVARKLALEHCGQYSDKSSQVSTLPKAKSKTRSKQSNDMHK